MQLLPSQESYVKRIEAVQEAYGRIPDPPHGNKLFIAYHKAAQQITVNFRIGALFLKEHSTEGFRETRKTQRADIDELESALEGRRVPEIKLSDVIRGQE